MQTRSARNAWLPAATPEWRRWHDRNLRAPGHRAILSMVAGLLIQLGPALAQSPLERVNKAVDAIGRSGLEQLRTFSVKGEGKFWEPDESHVAGGPGLHVTDLKIEIKRDLAANAARLLWERDYLEIPWPRMNTYTEIVAEGVGFVEGNDGGPRTASMRTDAPQRPMTGNRLATTLRELQRTAPTLLLEMKRNGAALEPHADIKVSGRRLPAVRYNGAGASFIVAFDPRSGLPERIRTLDFDPLHGDSTLDWIAKDWRMAGPIRYPFSQTYEVNGVKLMEFKLTAVEINPSLASGTFAVPGAIRSSAPTAATQNVPYLWILRRQLIGSYFDVDNLTHDPKRGELQLVDRAAGISQVQGTIHHTLIVEMDKYLVVFDAPYMDGYSKWVIAQARIKYPGKPIRYLVNTHHHIDHVAGFRSFLAEGATLVVGKGTRQFWRKAIARPSTLGSDAPRKPLQARIIEVGDRQVISDGKRRVELYDLPTKHSLGMLVGYIPDAKLGFQTDIWTGPGVDPMGARAMPRQRALVNLVKQRRLDVERFVGGHGRVGNYAELASTLDGNAKPEDSVYIANATNRGIAFNVSPNGSYWIPFELEKGKDAVLLNAAFINIVTGRLRLGNRIERTVPVKKGNRYQLVIDPGCKCGSVQPAAP